jgi:Flp pilus assembly protein TadD
MYTLFLATALLLGDPGEGTPAPPPLQPVPPAASVTALPAELRQRFRTQALSPPAPARQRLEQVLHFMLDADGLAITYDQGATYSVEQTYAERRANCLSFTLLFLALAREAGLDARPQEIEDTLSWHQEQNTIFRNSHINASVRIDGHSFTIDTAGDTLIPGDRPVAMSEQRLLAHYYNNLAMDQLAQGNVGAGQKLMDAALSADATYAPIWSNAGVLLLRQGNIAAAEHAYRQALEIDPEEDGALFNMIGLSRRLGDARREAEFRRRLARVQQEDPLHHFMQAMDYERNGDYAQAIRHYQRAIRLHTGEHRFYSALARAYLKAGNARGAGRALKRAQALTDGATRAAYRAQLQELKRPSN